MRSTAVTLPQMKYFTHAAGTDDPIAGSALFSRQEQSVGKNVNEPLHSFVIGNTQMAVSVHDPFDHEISMEVEEDHGHGKRRVQPAPAGLFPDCVHNRSKQTTELSGHILKGRNEMPVSEFNNIDVHQQPVLCVVIHHGAH